MGSTQSLFSPQNLIAVVLIVAIAATVYSKTSTSDATATPTSKSGAGKKGKKKKGAQDTPSTTSDKDRDRVPSKGVPEDNTLHERTIPGGIPEDAEASHVQPAVSKSAKEKKRKSKKPATPVPTTATSEGAAASAPVAGPSTSSASSRSSAGGQAAKRPSAPTEEPWTRVESRRRASGQNPTTSDAGLTTATSVGEDGSSTGTAEKTGDEEKNVPPKTLAEKKLPKGRKTKVDDMLESSQYPELSRVMRVTPGTNEQPASGFSWGDYEYDNDTRGADADGEDDGGWGVVKSRGKAKHSQSFTGAPAAPQPKAPETVTKKQRQNAAKRDATKAAKAEQEAERQAQLASHKRELEHTRIAEQYSRKGGAGGRSGNVSGGMQAVVDEKGKLVWD